MASNDPIPGISAVAVRNEGVVVGTVPGLNLTPAEATAILAEKAAAFAQNGPPTYTEPPSPSIDAIRTASANLNALKADKEWAARVTNGEPTALRQFKELNGVLSAASNADLALAGVSPDGR
jgi:hypothetical protein